MILKDMLIKYADIQVEAKDLRKRIDQIERSFLKEKTVTDCVKGTRQDGTFGKITVSGVPDAKRLKRESELRKLQQMLRAKEDELLEQLNLIESLIEGIEDSEMRMLCRLRYIDDLSYIRIARIMNQEHKRGRRCYSDESVRKKMQRFFEKSKKSV